MNTRYSLNAALLMAFLSVSGCGGGSDAGPGGADPGADTTPDAFTLKDTKDAEPGKFYTASMTVGGVDAPVKARVCCSGSSSIEFSIDGGRTFGTKPVDVENGDKIVVRLKAKAEASGIDNGSLFVGGTSASPDAEGTVEDNFQVVTKADVEAPKLAVHFPPPFSLASGETEIRVRGIVGDDSGIDSVTAPGVDVEIDKVSGEWSAVVPLDAGPNTIEITAKDKSGNQASTTVSVDTTAASIGSGAELTDIFDMAFDAETDTLWITARQDRVVALDVSTGARREVSGSVTGQGPAIALIQSIAIDSANGRVFVTDTGGNAVLAIDQVTGDRLMLTNNSGTGSGPVLDGPLTLTYLPGADHLYALQSGSDEVLKVMLGGTRSHFVDVPMSTISISISADGQYIYYDDTGPERSIDRVSIADEARKRMISGGHEDLLMPSAPEAAAAGFIYFIDRDGDSSLFELNVNTKAERVIANGNVGRGPDFEGLGRLAIDEGRKLVYLSDGKAVLAIDILTGDRLYIAK